MKKSIHFVLSGVLFLTAFIATAQINTRTGGATNVLANSPTTNTNVGIGTNTPKSKLDVEGGVSIGATYSGTTASPINGAIIEGNVGIGTINPTSKLEVVGDIKTSRIELINSLPNGTVFLDWKDKNKRCAVFNAGTLRDPEDNGRNFYFSDFPQSNLDSKPYVRFGIDDRTNFTRFSVIGEQGGYTNLTVFNKRQEEVMKLYEDGNDNVIFQFGKPNSKVNIGGYSDYPNSIGHKLFVQGGSAKIEGNILTDSNIGIGTSNFIDGSDIYRLSVKGAIRADRVKVYTTWSDFVFEKNYQLDTLAEVEKHILIKGHLKDIPSAKEVEENGIELGEMNKLLLQKVEELTLYLIEMNKQMQQMELQIKKQ